MINSMTAYAHAESTGPRFTVTIEMRSFNSRHLDLVLRMPHGYQGAEDRLKRLAAGRITRGRVEVYIKIKDAAESTCAFEVDANCAAAYHSALTELQRRFALPPEISLEMLAGAPGVIKSADVVQDTEAVLPVLTAVLTQAIDSLLEMRAREGAILAADLTARLEFVEQSLDHIANRASITSPPPQRS
jgi:uncharacterized protein (TIGR00255 family)